MNIHLHVALCFFKCQLERTLAAISVLLLVYLSRCGLHHHICIVWHSRLKIECLALMNDPTRLLQGGEHIQRIFIAGVSSCKARVKVLWYRMDHLATLLGHYCFCLERWAIAVSGVLGMRDPAKILRVLHKRRNNATDAASNDLIILLLRLHIHGRLFEFAQGRSRRSSGCHWAP